MNFEEKLGHGFELLKEKDIDASLDVARELQKENPEDPEAFYLEALIMQQLNQYDMSIKSLDWAIKINDQESKYINLRGYARMQKEELEEAEKDFNKSIELDDSPSAHRNIIMLMLMTDRGQDAFAYLIDRIKKDPRDIENWILMGDMMKRAGQTDKARTYYEQALKMDPDNEYAMRQLEEE